MAVACEETDVKIWSGNLCLNRVSLSKLAENKRTAVQSGAVRVSQRGTEHVLRPILQPYLGSCHIRHVYDRLSLGLRLHVMAVDPLLSPNLAK